MTHIQTTQTTPKPLRIGLFGFGCVGSGLYKVLTQTNNLDISIQKICIKHPGKKRALEPNYFTTQKQALLDDPLINVIVELIDDAEEAFLIVKEAISKGKAVVSANKKMIAEHFQELFDLQQRFQTPFLYEAAVAGSIPILRSLEEYYDNDTLSSLEGILNGTTNYILSQTQKTGKTYHEVLHTAQELGFAETNPELDVQAYDPKFKLTILLAHAFGIIVNPTTVLNYGIHHLQQEDLRYAEEKGLTLKLIAHAAKQNNHVTSWVLPTFIPAAHSFATVQDEFNAVQVAAAFSDKQLLTGKGAGSYPTAAAVLSDISALRYGYRYGYRKLHQSTAEYVNSEKVKVYLRYHNQQTLDAFAIESIEEQFKSNRYQYVIGYVSIEHLLKVELNKRSDFFLALIHPETSMEQVSLAEEVLEA